MSFDSRRDGRADWVAVKRRVVGFHQDDELHWVADLECGHTQHVRHDPPWQVRSWVTTVEGREAHLGMELNCLLCSEQPQGRGP